VARDRPRDRHDLAGGLMATFAYRAMDAKGAATSGQMDADNKAAVSAALRNKGLTIVDITEVKTSLAKIDVMAPLQRIKPKDLTIFSRQFATMISSGLAMMRALAVLEEQTENKKLATIVGQIRADVESGIALSDALAKHPKTFSRLYVSMVRAGEIGGVLDEVLNRLATQLEKDDAIRRAVKSAMVYPVMIGSFAIIVLIGMVLFLIPIFASMYKDMGNAKLPMLTRIMVTASNTMRSWKGAVVVAVIIGAIILLRRLKRTPAGTMLWDRMKLRIPMGIGEIVRKMAVARFSRTLGTLVAAGVPILQAIEITGQSAGNVVIEKAMEKVQGSVKEGQTISGPLESVSVFPEMVVQMLAVGEETGNLDTMLNKVADFYEDEVNASVKSLTSILEPIMMLGVGALVGTVVISMYLPIFNMMNVVKE
jgi:type IV pilus assembly protein PilC